MCKTGAMKRKQIDAKEMQNGGVKEGSKVNQEGFVFVTGLKRGEEKNRHS